MKEYKNDHLVVYWYPELCSHAGKCFTILPGVFKPQERPWINLEAATPEEIIRCVDKCPSGALRYSLPESSQVELRQAQGPGWMEYEKEHPAVTKIKMVKNGPLILDGPVAIHGHDGQLLKEGSKTVLCRCGLSCNRPFCDGTHARQGWQVD